MTTRNYYCVNRYNVETDQWEYVPRYVRVHGEVTEIGRSAANDNDDENDN